MRDEDAGVVDEDVETPELLGSRIDRAPYCVGVGHVRLHGGVPVTGERRDHVLGPVGRAPVVHRDPVALLGEHARNGRADAAGTAGDENPSPAGHFAISPTPAMSRSTSSAFVYGASPARTAPAS